MAAAGAAMLASALLIVGGRRRRGPGTGWDAGGPGARARGRARALQACVVGDSGPRNCFLVLRAVESPEGPETLWQRGLVGHLASWVVSGNNLECSL